MSAETKFKKANRFGWQGSAAAIVAVVILSSPFWGSAQAAEKDGAKAMDSMDMHKAMMKGMKDMESMPATGDTDHDFAMMMKKHHQSALDMANVELQQGRDPNLRTMAKGIIKSQTKEIQEFDNWLAKATHGRTHVKIKISALSHKVMTPGTLGCFTVQPFEENQHDSANRDEPGYAKVY